MQRFTFLGVSGALAVTPLLTQAYAQSVPINYDALSFFEEPLAIELGPTTLSARLLADQAAQYDWSLEDESYNSRVIGDLRLGGQLANGWRVNVNYVGNYNRLAADEYTDNAALAIADAWGTVAAGDVTGAVREVTRRARGAGNANLANDDFLGGLDESGGFYSVRFNSYQLAMTADQSGRAEIGLAFERPIGKRNYFLSARARRGDTSERPGMQPPAETWGAAVVGEYSFASFQIDGQLGFETVDFENADRVDDHVFGSVGFQYKYGAYSFSAEGGLGEYDGDDRHALALGSRIDVARGLSLNLGVNHKSVAGQDQTLAIGSARYEF